MKFSFFLNAHFYIVDYVMVTMNTTLLKFLRLSAIVAAALRLTLLFPMETLHKSFEDHSHTLFQPLSGLARQREYFHSSNCI